MLSGLFLVWSVNPASLIFLVLLSLLYLFGFWRASRRHRDGSQDAPVRIYHILSFFGAIILAALVLLTPLDTVARTQLFIAHIIQVVILITFCTPLLLFGTPAIMLRSLLELLVVRHIFSGLTHPVVASLIFNLVFVIWHIPSIYALAMADATLYHIQLLSIFVTSWLSWWPLIGPVQVRRPLSYGLRILYAFLDGQPIDIFAFVLLLSSVVFYPGYQHPSSFGISPVTEQVLAGGILLIPGLADLVIMSINFLRLLAQIERRTQLDDLKREQEAEEEWEEGDENARE